MVTTFCKYNEHCNEYWSLYIKFTKELAVTNIEKQVASKTYLVAPFDYLYNAWSTKESVLCQGGNKLAFSLPTCQIVTNPVLMHNYLQMHIIIIVLSTMPVLIYMFNLINFCSPQAKAWNNQSRGITNPKLLPAISKPESLADQVVKPYYIHLKTTGIVFPMVHSLTNLQVKINIGSLMFFKIRKSNVMAQYTLFFINSPYWISNI